MPPLLIQHLASFLALTVASDQRNVPFVRDRLLTLSAATAARLHLGDIADFCRQRVLEHNPHHMMGRWPNVATALQDDDFLALIKQLQRRFPPEKAEQMLSEMGATLKQRRDNFSSDEEFAAAILSKTPAEIAEGLGRYYGS